VDVSAPETNCGDDGQLSAGAPPTLLKGQATPLRTQRQVGLLTSRHMRKGIAHLCVAFPTTVGRAKPTRAS
jgi:hypothetical protein